MEKPTWAFSKVTFFNFLQDENGQKTFYFSDFEHNWDIFQFLIDKHTYYFVLNENIKSRYNFEIISACYRQKCRHLTKVHFITTLPNQEELIRLFPELPDSICRSKYVERYDVDVVLLRRFATYTYQDAIDLFNENEATIERNDESLTRAIAKCIKKRRRHSFQSIAFFGASVTGQLYSYVDSLKKKKKDYQHSITKWGYGGCHINHATWLVHEVLPTKPSVCILEWTTSAFQPTNDELSSYLHYIVDKLEEANIVPIFMYLYKKDIDLFKNIIDVYETVAKQRNISSLHCCDIFSDDISLSGLLKDSCHTTATGSNFYGSIIERCLFDYLANDDFDVLQEKEEQVKDIIWKPLQNVQVVNIEYLCDTTGMQTLNFENRVYYRIDNLLQLQFQNNVHVWSANILFYKNNGFVEINGDRLQTWDKNCYYKRFGFLDLKKDVDRVFEIKVLQESFDTTECKYTSSFPAEKCLWISYLVLRDCHTSP